MLGLVIEAEALGFVFKIFTGLNAILKLPHQQSAQGKLNKRIGPINKHR